MNDFSEQEQLEALRAWWKENGWQVIGGLVIGAALIVGWNAWQKRDESAAIDASIAYEALVEQVANAQVEPARARAEELFNEYGGSVYALQGRLAMARLYMDSGRDKDAAEVLQPAATGDTDDVLVQVARLRLAKILLYQNKPQAVLDLLGEPGDTAFAARYNEVIGDAHFALGDLEQTTAAYAAALADAQAAQTVNTRFVRMKLDDVAAAQDAAATTSASRDPAATPEIPVDEDPVDDMPGDEAEE